MDCYWLTSRDEMCFIVGWVRRILTLLFVAHSKTVFGLIFGMDVIFFGLVETERSLFGG
jgi:hypothetical protein